MPSRRICARRQPVGSAGGKGVSTRVCGKPADRATPGERMAAYARVCATTATRVDLAMLLDSPNSDHQGVWVEVFHRWTPQRDTGTDDDASDVYRLALLAADGLWLNDTLGPQHIAPDKRDELADQIIDLVREAGPGE